MRTARRFLVTGRVQRVGFRFFADEVARREGLTGYARNLPDGNVEIVVDGEVEAVDRFERAIRHGPRAARVDEVMVEALGPGQVFREFEIRH